MRRWVCYRAARPCRNDRGSVAGISTDEAIRLKDSPDRWMTNRYPLIEAGMPRRDCMNWLCPRGRDGLGDGGVARGRDRSAIPRLRGRYQASCSRCTRKCNGRGCEIGALRSRGIERHADVPALADSGEPPALGKSCEQTACTGQDGLGMADTPNANSCCASGPSRC